MLPRGYAWCVSEIGALGDLIRVWVCGQGQVGTLRGIWELLCKRARRRGWMRFGTWHGDDCPKAQKTHNAIAIEEKHQIGKCTALGRLGQCALHSSRTRGHDSVGRSTCIM